MAATGGEFSQGGCLATHTPVDRQPGLSGPDRRTFLELEAFSGAVFALGFHRLALISRRPRFVHPLAAVFEGKPMSTGTIKWFSVARKYGFIVPDEGGKDVFVHMSALNTAKITYLDDGARVSFELDEAAERRSAVNLTVLTPVVADVVDVEVEATDVADAPVVPILAVVPDVSDASDVPGPVVPEIVAAVAA
jgi:CspA family cold shock protein